jgi:hypothetical protein
MNSTCDLRASLEFEFRSDDERELFDERAAICEIMGGLSERDAMLEAWASVLKLRLRRGEDDQ